MYTDWISIAMIDSMVWYYGDLSELLTRGLDIYMTIYFIMVCFLLCQCEFSPRRENWIFLHPNMMTGSDLGSWSWWKSSSGWSSCPGVKHSITLPRTTVQYSNVTVLYTSPSWLVSLIHVWALIGLWSGPPEKITLTLPPQLLLPTINLLQDTVREEWIPTCWVWPERQTGLPQLKPVKLTAYKWFPW